jgi:hypothetical protein
VDIGTLAQPRDRIGDLRARRVRRTAAQNARRVSVNRQRER